MRRLAVELAINPNTVIRAYRELEREGIVEIRHGAGAFVSQSGAGRTKISRKAQSVMQTAIDRLSMAGLTEDEIRRLVENELAQLRAGATLGTWLYRIATNVCLDALADRTKMSMK